MRSIAIALLAFAALAASPARAELYSVTLSGAAEAPPNASPGVGSGLVNYDPIAHLLRVAFSFSGLTSNTTASHIHCCAVPPGTASVATAVPTFPDFPLGVTSGTYDRTFDLTVAASWNPAFINANGGTTASAEAVLAAGLRAGQAYLNVHTTTFPAGEIRGFISAVPEPSTYALLAIGLAGLGWTARRRARS